MMFAIRLFYVAVVLAGFWVNLQEYRHARWVYRELWAQQINGVRQMIARTFMVEEKLKLQIQAWLLVPALAGLILPRQLVSDVPRPYRGIVVLSIVAHIVVAWLLARKSVKHRFARRAILDLEDRS